MLSTLAASLAICLALLTSSGAAADAPSDRWEIVKIASDKSTVMFASRDRILINGNVRSIWAMMVDRNAPSLEGKVVAYFLIRYTFNCSIDEYKTDYIVSYDKDDASIVSSRSADGYAPVIPESLIDGVAQRACGTATRSDDFTWDSRKEAVEMANKIFRH